MSPLTNATSNTSSAALFQSSKLAQRISSSRPKGGRRRITTNGSKPNLDITSQERFSSASDLFQGVGGSSQMSQTVRNLRGSMDIKKR